MSPRAGAPGHGRPTTSCSRQPPGCLPRRSRRCASGRRSRPTWRRELAGERIDPRACCWSARAATQHARHARRRGRRRPARAARRRLHRVRPRGRAGPAAADRRPPGARHDQPHAAHAGAQRAPPDWMCARWCSRPGRSGPAALELSNRETIARLGAVEVDTLAPIAAPTIAELAGGRRAAAVAALDRRLRERIPPELELGWSADRATHIEAHDRPGVENTGLLPLGDIGWAADPLRKWCGGVTQPTIRRLP